MQRLGIRCHRRSKTARRPGALAPRGLLPALLATMLSCACQSPDGLEEWTMELVEELPIGTEPVTLQTALYRPSGLGHDHLGNVFVLDAGNNRVQVFTPGGEYLRSMGSPGSAPGQLSDPMGMFVHPDGSVWVADTRNRRIQPFGAASDKLDPIGLDFFPVDIVVGPDRMFVQRLPQTSMTYGPDPFPIIRVLDRQGTVTGGFVDAVPAVAGIMYMLENMICMAPARSGGVAVSSTHFASRVRVYGPGGALRIEIPVLYKAGAWAPLGRRPGDINEASLDRVARTSSDLAWDEVRQLFWVLAGYVDRTADDEWVIGREVYRYDADGTYRGSLMLPQLVHCLNRLIHSEFDGLAKTGVRLGVQMAQ